MKTNEKGISLIVLVVTIIVLAILAATVIVSITNSGIINRATDTVKVYDLSEVRSLANLAWAEALMDENVRTDAEYDAYVKGKLTDAGVNIADYNIGATSSGVTVTQNGSQGETEYAGLTITKDTPNVTFTKADGITPGDPDNIEDGDIVIYEYYEYRYNCEYTFNNKKQELEWCASEINGWGVKLKDDYFMETTVGELCGNIYGKPLVSMLYAYVTTDSGAMGFAGVMMASFYGASIITAPAIPSSVTNMESTFECCLDLTTAPPAIPSSVTNMAYTFSECYSLTTAPDMSRATSVTNMERTFEYCENLTTAPVIPSSVTNMESTFDCCSSLTAAPEIPSNVTNMSCTFYYCSSLTAAPEIPSNVTDMSYTFYRCTSLTGIVQINSSIVSNMNSCFNNITESITVRVPANSTTSTTISTADLGSSTIITETFEP